MELPQLTPAYVEILMVRELRKAGLEVSEVQTHRRADLTEPARVFVLELLAWLRQADWRRRALVVCRRQETLLTEAAVESARDRCQRAQAQVGILFSTADLEPSALIAARRSGVAVLRIAEARAAFDASGWGPAGHYPPWLPAYIAQTATLDPAGQIQYHWLEGGHWNRIVDQFQAVVRLPLIVRGEAFALLIRDDE